MVFALSYRRARGGQVGHHGGEVIGAYRVIISPVSLSLPMAFFINRDRDGRMFTGG